MDDLEKKMFLQCDDDMPAQRANAVESLREYMLKKTPPRKFRDLVADFENALSPAMAEELEKKLAAFESANAVAAERNADLTRRNADLTREIGKLKAALWVKTNWKMVGAGAAALLVVVAGGWTYERYWSRSDAVTAGLRATVAAATWGEGWGEPFASRIGGEPYWLMFRGDIDASNYSDNHGNPVEMRCLHLYAAPAEPDSGQYRKASPRNFLGWVNWPELAMQCKPSPNQRADK